MEQRVQYSPVITTFTHFLDDDKFVVDTLIIWSPYTPQAHLERLPVILKERKKDVPVFYLNYMINQAVRIYIESGSSWFNDRLTISQN